MGNARRGRGAAADRAVHDRIAAAAAREGAIRAPDGLLDSVMRAVYRESLRGSPGLEEPAAAARAYRRIGWSFVLSAALVAAALLVPSGLLPAGARADGVARVLRAGEQSVVRNVLSGAEAVVRGALRPSAIPAPATQGGTSR
jgi:hypothetical protein